MTEAERRVASVFDAMEHDYDEISDLWYAWLFSRLHLFICDDIISRWPLRNHTVIDIGCGTGLQAFLYSAAGATVTGIDISERLIEVARYKARQWRPGNPLRLFPSHFDFVERYNRLITASLAGRCGSIAYEPPEFTVASALALPFPDGMVDHVNCCGSVLSFLEDHRLALAEIARVLKPGGTFIIEVEARYNADILWPLIDWLLGGCLGYDMSLRDAVGVLTPGSREPISIEYPFGETSNPVYMNIKLFTQAGLTRDCKRAGLEPRCCRSIHSVTNLIPSTLLDTSKPSSRLVRVFGMLSRIEQKLRNVPGCSLVVTGTRSLPAAIVRD